MIHILSDDVIDILLRKFHKFNYLFNLLYINKYFNEKTKNILKYHFKKMQNYLNIYNNYNVYDTNYINYINNIYLNISLNLFNNKILNIRKLNCLYYNNIILLEISNLIKVLVLFNEYYDYNICVDYFKIINLKELTLFIEHAKNYNNHFPFIIISLQDNFKIFIEYSIFHKKYRLKLKYKHTDVSMYKSIEEQEIINLFTLSKKNILKIYL